MTASHEITARSGLLQECRRWSTLAWTYSAPSGRRGRRGSSASRRVTEGAGPSVIAMCPLTLAVFTSGALAVAPLAARRLLFEAHRTYCLVYLPVWPSIGEAACQSNSSATRCATASACRSRSTATPSSSLKKRHTHMTDQPSQAPLPPRLPHPRPRPGRPRRHLPQRAGAVRRRRRARLRRRLGRAAPRPPRRRRAAVAVDLPRARGRAHQADPALHRDHDPAARGPGPAGRGPLGRRPAQRRPGGDRRRQRRQRPRVRRLRP